MQSRKYLIRAGAVLLGLLPFVLFELALYVGGWRAPDAIDDPYVGFSEIRTLFQMDKTGTRYEISQNRFPLFCPADFLVEKPKNEFRIFCVGGSTVQGRPFANETAFGKWLELRLEATDSLSDYKVINCGGVSYASYRLAPIIEEILYHQPDLIVLYTGHNEFLEDRTYAAVKATPPWIRRTHARLSSIRTYSFIRSCVIGNKSTTSESLEELPAEVEARLDFRNGLEKYHRDDEWKRNVTIHFEHNLRRMVAAVDQAEVPLVLCNPASNLRDASPFKSENTSGMKVDESQRFDELMSRLDDSGSMMSLADQEAVLSEMATLNPRHADTLYRLGQTYQQLGKLDLAKSTLIKAKDEDVCPLRIVEPMYGSIAKISREFNTASIDVKALFERRAPDGIPGTESLLDHVHPTIHGHQLIAELLFEEMVEMNLVSDNVDESERSKLFESHLESLPNMYFELGKDRLAGLKRWAEGRVTRERESEEGE